MAELVLTVGEPLQRMAPTRTILSLDDLRDENPFLRDPTPALFIYTKTAFDGLKDYRTPHKFWEELIHDFARDHCWDYSERSSGDGFVFSLANIAHNNGSHVRLTAFYAYPDTAIRDRTAERKVQGYFLEMKRFPDDSVAEIFARKKLSEMVEGKVSAPLDEGVN